MTRPQLILVQPDDVVYEASIPHLGVEPVVVTGEGLPLLLDHWTREYRGAVVTLDRLSDAPAASPTVDLGEGAASLSEVDDLGDRPDAHSTAVGAVTGSNPCVAAGDTITDLGDVLRAGHDLRSARGLR